MKWSLPVAQDLASVEDRCPQIDEVVGFIHNRQLLHCLTSTMEKVGVDDSEKPADECSRLCIRSKPIPTIVVLGC